MNKPSIKLNFLISPLSGIVLLLVLFTGCAAQGPPGGGAEDKTGPILLSTFPENGTVNADRKTGVVLNFSETIEPRSVESKLVITPYPGRTAIIKANRKRVTIDFLEPLQENTTYIISFGRGIQDYQKNPSEINVTIAFSTGDSLDSGTISGTVYGIPKKHNAQVWAFRKTDSFPDSILDHTPDYKTSVEKDGRYRLTNLARGNYRLLAVSSEAARIVLIDENCLLGMPACQRETAGRPVVDPVLITHRNTVVSGVNFRLGKFYLKPFRLLKASMSDDKTELLFSRSLDTEQNSKAYIQIDNDAEIQSFWISHLDPKTIILKAREMVSNTKYTVRVDNIVDDLGDMLKLNNTATFTYSEGVDTLKPEIVSTVPSKGAKNIHLNAKVRIVFSEALKQTISDSSILFISKDSIPTDYSFIWQGDNSIVLSPKTRLASAMEYRITFDCSDWSDLAGNQFKDSLFTLLFSTVDANSFGSISGKILLSDSTVNQLILSCFPEKEGAAPVTNSVSGAGIYIIDSLLPGAYRFEIWDDLIGNGKWDPGKLKPFVPAEPYRSYPDKINVRARWETAEVDWTY